MTPAPLRDPSRQPRDPARVSEAAQRDLQNDATLQAAIEQRRQVQEALKGLAIGRIVMYVCPDQYLGLGGVMKTVGIRPAIVTRVLTTTDERPTGLVNLHVIFDIDDPSIHTMQEWRPSVDYDEAKRLGSWHWPPRV